MLEKDKNDVQMYRLIFRVIKSIQDEDEFVDRFEEGVAFMGIKTAMDQTIGNYSWPKFAIETNLEDKSGYQVARGWVTLFADVADLLPEPYGEIYIQMVKYCDICENMKPIVMEEDEEGDIIGKRGKTIKEQVDEDKGRQ